MYQNTVVVGYLGRDPEMRYTPSGSAVTSFSIATTRKWTSQDGQPREKQTGGARQQAIDPSPTLPLEGSGPEKSDPGSGS